MTKRLSLSLFMAEGESRRNREWLIKGTFWGDKYILKLDSDDHTPHSEYAKTTEWYTLKS